MNINYKPAFPSHHFEDDELQGMTLRDYFAAKAMQGMMSNDNLLNRYKISGEENYISPDVMACTAAYSMADAMLEARNK